jgi:hypothetical protein
VLSGNKRKEKGMCDTFNHPQGQGEASGAKHKHKAIFNQQPGAELAVIDLQQLAPKVNAFTENVKKHIVVGHLMPQDEEAP